MWVKAVGIVVAIDEWSGSRVCTIDDSSGASIECVIDIPKHPSSLSSTTKVDDAVAEEGKVPIATVQTASTKEEKRPVVGCDVDIGDCIQVTGCIMQAKWARKIKVSKVTHLRSTADEVMFWNKLAKFYRDVLSQPWVLGEKEIRRCRRQANAEPEETDGKQRVKEKKRGFRETGLKTKHLPKAMVSDRRGSPKRRSTGLEGVSKRIKTVDHETAKVTGHQETRRALRKGTQICDPAAAGKTRSTSLGSISKQPRTVRVADGTALRLGTKQPTREFTPGPGPVIAAKHRATGLEPNVGRSNHISLIEYTRTTSSHNNNATEELISDTQTSKRLKRTGLEGACKRPRTIQAGGTFDTDCNNMVRTTEEGLVEADTMAAAKTRAARFEPASTRLRIVRTSTGGEDLRGVPDEVTALNTQIASRRTATRLERTSERPMKVREHEATVLHPESEKSVKDSTRRPQMEAASHKKVTGLEPESKRPRPSRPASGSSTGIGKRATDITAALDAVRTRVTGLERRSRRPTGTPVEGI
jgi:hypothetical protein